MEATLNSSKGKSLKAGDQQHLGGGLVFNPAERSIAISPRLLEPATNFFCADHFRLKVNGSHLEIMFGQVNSFSEQKDLTLAIQVTFPIEMAIASFYEMAWVNPGSSGLAPFAETLKNVVNKSISSYGAGVTNSNFESYSLPPQSESRKFATNFATCAYSNGEATIDFYQVSPQLIHYALNTNSVRPNERIQNIFAVVLTLELLFEFLNASKELLLPYLNQEKDV